MGESDGVEYLRSLGWTVTEAALVCPHGWAHTIVPQGYEVEDMPQWDAIVHRIMEPKDRRHTERDAFESSGR